MGRKLNSETPLEITIKTRNNQERNQIGEKIHNVLKGNPDYVNNAIVLNIDRDKRVRLWVYDESETQLNMVATKKRGGGGMKTGAVVIVKVAPFVDRHYLYTGKRKAAFMTGIVEFVSERWITVMLLSDKNRSPLYRESFWKENVYEKRRRGYQK